MIEGHVPDSSGNYTRHASTGTTVPASLVVEAPTGGKDQLMVYIKLTSPAATARVRFTFEMSDPRINGGEPFRMSQMDGANVVPMTMELAREGSYRVPVPVGANEQRLSVRAELLEADPEADSVAFWVASNAYQPVSGLYT